MCELALNVGMMSEILIEFYCITPINAISSERTYEEKARNGVIRIHSVFGVRSNGYGIILNSTNSQKKRKKEKIPGDP